MSSETNSALASMLIRFTVAQVEPALDQGPRHYSVGLQADGLDTGIWYDGLTEQEADEQAALMLAEAPQLLTFYGVHEEVYALCHAQRALAATGLQIGDMVRLSRDAAGFPAGQPCRVERVDLKTSGDGLDTLFPVVVSFPTTAGFDGGLLVPLELADIDAPEIPAEKHV